MSLSTVSGLVVVQGKPQGAPARDRAAWAPACSKGEGQGWLSLAWSPAQALPTVTAPETAGPFPPLLCNLSPCCHSQPHRTNSTEALNPSPHPEAQGPHLIRALSCLWRLVPSVPLLEEGCKPAPACGLGPGPWASCWPGRSENRQVRATSGCWPTKSSTNPGGVPKPHLQVHPGPRNVMWGVRFLHTFHSWLSHAPSPTPHPGRPGHSHLYPPSPAPP